jgi:hypothetical protein
VRPRRGHLRPHPGGTDEIGDRLGSHGAPRRAAFGLGGEFDFTRNLGVRAEWQRYAKMKVRNDVNGVEDDGDVDALTVGVVYRFR